MPPSEFSLAGCLSIGRQFFLFLSRGLVLQLEPLCACSHQWKQCLFSLKCTCKFIFCPTEHEFSPTLGCNALDIHKKTYLRDDAISDLTWGISGFTAHTYPHSFCVPVCTGIDPPSAPVGPPDTHQHPESSCLLWRHQHDGAGEWQPLLQRPRLHTNQ